MPSGPDSLGSGPCPAGSYAPFPGCSQSLSAPASPCWGWTGGDPSVPHRSTLEPWLPIRSARQGQDLGAAMPTNTDRVSLASRMLPAPCLPPLTLPNVDRCFH